MVEAILLEEIVAEIGKYLDVDDILNCCLVSTHWRNSLNINRIWSELCSSNYDVLITEKNPVLSEESQVKPFFVRPQSSCERLPDLCAWRIRFIQEVRIVSNWKNAMYTTTLLNDDLAYDFKNSFDRFALNDDFLVGYDDSKNLFRVARLANSVNVYFDSEIFIKTSISGKIDYLHATKNGFIYVQKNLLVFNTKCQNFSFEQHRVVINEDKNFSKSIPDDEDITLWYKKNIKNEIQYIYYCTDKYFAAFSTGYETQLHIWDFKGDKMAEFDLSKYRRFIQPVPKKSSLNFFLVNFSSPEDIVIQSASYHLGRLNTVTGGWSCILSQKHLTEDADFRWYFYLWDLDDMKLVKYTRTSNVELVIFSRRYIGMIEEEVIRLIDARTLELHGTINISGVILKTVPLKGDLLLVHVRTYPSNITQLWNLKTRRQIITMPFLSSVDFQYLNQSKTKCFDKVSGKVLNFW